MIKVAIIHFHLNRGGVTQVIANHLQALNTQTEPSSRMPVAVLHGGRTLGWPADVTDELSGLAVSLHKVGELDYDSERPHCDCLAQQIDSTLAQAGFGVQETILHVHNHSLGKNVALPDAITRLAKMGYAILLQVHDFAEDFRPELYVPLKNAVKQDAAEGNSAGLYPQASHLHYAVLNSRDHSILQTAGVDDGRLHRLPNPVTEPRSLPSKSESRTRLMELAGIPTSDCLVLYPVRGIRRKNLGEALLWSAVAGTGFSFGLTLSPLNPVEQSSYSKWKDVADELELNWCFDIGNIKGLHYVDILSASDLILTTSIAEGFGMAFLEPWLVGRPVVGRDLPSITRDFVDAGIRFPGLQPRLSIPVEWIGRSRLIESITDSWNETLARYSTSQSSSADLHAPFEKLLEDGLVDFAVMDVESQRMVISRVSGNNSDRETIHEINAWMKTALKSWNADDSFVEHNAMAVRQAYCLASCGRTLRNIYQQLASSNRDNEPQPIANERHILDQFLDLSRFHPLRVD